MAKFKCVTSQSKRWIDGKEYVGTPGAVDGGYNVMDENGAEWTVTPGEDGFYRYTKNVQPSATFAMVIDQ